MNAIFTVFCQWLFPNNSKRNQELADSIVLTGSFFKECYKFQGYFLEFIVKTRKLIALLILIVILKYFKKFMLLPALF